MWKEDIKSFGQAHRRRRRAARPAKLQQARLLRKKNPLPNVERGFKGSPPEARGGTPRKTPAGKVKYHDAIREFFRGGGEGVDLCPRPNRCPTERLAGASETSPDIT